MGDSHSNSNSWLSGLDFLCLTSPKMPPRCLFTQLRLHGWVPPSLAASEMKRQQQSHTKALTVFCHSAVIHSKHLSFCKSAQQSIPLVVSRYNMTSLADMFYYTGTWEGGENRHRLDVICRLRRFLPTCRQAAVSQ